MVIVGMDYEAHVLMKQFQGMDVYWWSTIYIERVSSTRVLQMLKLFKAFLL